MAEAMLTEEDLRNMSPEEIAELQRKNCIFCKIIRDEIPAKKVYEDDQMVAILDINPATKGHALVMPREHYPLLPLLPMNLFNHIFSQTQRIAKAIREATLAPGLTVFIANGAAAGQQSPHFLFHLIPRENATDLDNFNLPQQGWPTLDQNIPALKQQTRVLLQHYLTRTGKLKPAPTYGPPQPPVSVTPRNITEGIITPTEQPLALSEPLIQEVEAKPAPKDPFHPTNLPELLENNTELRRMVIHHPDELVQFVKTNPELAKLFQDVNIHKLSQKLADYEKNMETK